MSNKDYTEPRQYRVAGYRLNTVGGVIGTFDMTFNVRSIAEGISQAEYIFKDEDIRVNYVKEAW